MKLCPKCNAEYGYDMSFCLEDGTPLETVDTAVRPTSSNQKTAILTKEHLPNETEDIKNINEPTVYLPKDDVKSENVSEKTVVLPDTVLSQPTIASIGNRVNESNNWTNKQSDAPPQYSSSPSILSLSDYETEQQKSKSGLIIGGIIAGVLLIGLAIGATVFFQTQSSEEIALSNTANSNKSDLSEKSASGKESNINTSQIFPENSNANNLTNSSVKLTPKATATVENTKPTPINDTEKEEINKPDAKTPIQTTPRPTQTKYINQGVINGEAVKLVQPSYPPAARAVRASGQVSVRVVIDENGNVISANAVNGHSLLQSSAEQAARASKFSPSQSKRTGSLVYTFSP